MSEKARYGGYDQIKAATKLALKHRKAIKEGNFTPFIPALAFALAKDGILDMLDILIVTKLLGIFIAVYLFIFLWGRGTWKVRLVVFVLSCLDFIPIIDMLPMSTVCVLYAYHHVKKKAKEAKKELNVLNASFNNSL